MLVFSFAAARAGATSVATLPLAPTASTLAQTGQELTWTVVTAQPFRPKSLAKQSLSLCLVIAQGAKTVRLCVAGPARILDASTGRYVDATVTRSSLDQLAASFTPTSIGLQYRPVHWQVMSALTVPPCAAGPGCEIEFPRRPESSRLHVPQLVGCVPTGPRFVYSGPSDRKQIALTFDDGPWYQTPQFVSLLERYHVPATFFEIGDQIAEFGEGGAIERRMLADGDMIGDHTWNHPDVAGGGAFARNEIVEAAEAIKRATHGFEPCLFRAPYGDVSPGAVIARSFAGLHDDSVGHRSARLVATRGCSDLRERA